MNCAVIIGCNSYPEDPEILHTLRCAENDARALKEILETPFRGDFGDVRLFTNEPSHEIIDSIYNCLDKAMNNDMVLIYHAGHGRLDRFLDLHLCTHNTRSSSLPTTSLPVAQIKKIYRPIPLNKNRLYT